MFMTNYMDLLAANSPWNLIFFMVIPMVLAEALVSTEFFAVYFGEKADKSRKWNRILGIAAGVYYTLMVIYFLFNVFPTIQFRGWIDAAAIFSLLLATFPILGLALMELGVWGKTLTGAKAIFRRFFLLISFLIVSHLAMVFGMTDPTLSGWQPENPAMQMNHNGHQMPTQQMPMTDHSPMMNHDMPMPQNGTQGQPHH